MTQHKLKKKKSSFYWHWLHEIATSGVAGQCYKDARNEYVFSKQGEEEIHRCKEAEEELEVIHRCKEVAVTAIHWCNEVEEVKREGVMMICKEHQKGVEKRMVKWEALVFQFHKVAWQVRTAMGKDAGEMHMESWYEGMEVEVEVEAETLLEVQVAMCTHKVGVGIRMCNVEEEPQEAVTRRHREEMQEEQLVGGIHKHMMEV